MLQPELLSELRSRNPLIHCITNYVVANFQANGLLALGASPVMAEAAEEAAEIAGISSCLSLNIGTLTEETVKSMILAGKAANRNGVPVVLDPVGAGASAFRKSVTMSIIGKVKLALIRCNAGELAAIAGAQWEAQGVDAGKGDLDIGYLARDIALKYETVVAVTGKTDIITDGISYAEVENGSPLLPSVTGSGCLLSSVAGAFISIANHPFAGTVTALAAYGIAGEEAAARSEGPGDFIPHFVNSLHSLTSETIKKAARVTIGKAVHS